MDAALGASLGIAPGEDSDGFLGNEDSDAQL